MQNRQAFSLLFKLVYFGFDFDDVHCYPLAYFVGQLFDMVKSARRFLPNRLYDFLDAYVL